MARILLVEPDRVLAKVTSEALERAGHEVPVCTGAQAAVSAADTAAPDLVILEVQLVEHSGIEFLYEFRSYLDWLHIPVLIHTNVPAGEFSASAELLEHELGVSAYLYKPATSLQKLLSAVNQHCPAAA